MAWASPVAMRAAWMSPAGRRCAGEKTAPHFWARPVMSRVETPFAVEVGGHADQGAEGDDAHAADPGDDQVVGWVVAGSCGAGRIGQSGVVDRAPPFAQAWPPSMVTKLGQKPLRQEKILVAG